MYIIALVFAFIVSAPQLTLAQQSQPSTQGAQSTAPQQDREPPLQGQQDYGANPRAIDPQMQPNAVPGETQGLQQYPNRANTSAERRGMSSWFWVVIAVVALFAVLVPLARRRPHPADTTGPRGGPQT